MTPAHGFPEHDSAAGVVRAAGREAPILCVGEVLWDVLPSGMFLGGAPFNVACDLHQLGCTALMVSRVGNDELGNRVLEEMRSRGMNTGLMQRDRELPTGTVDVAIDPHGAPQYTINHPSAWDAISLPESALHIERHPSIIVFGSLAQRSPTSRATIRSLCAGCDTRIFDVNLRAPYDDPDVVRSSLGIATILKLNRDELAAIARWFGLPRDERSCCRAIAERFGCSTVCLTKDGEGAALYHESRWIEHSGFRIRVKDTVGAGDAFLAGFIAQMRAKKSGEEILAYANLLGAFAASSDGATPRFSPDDIDEFRRRLDTV